MTWIELIWCVTLPLVLIVCIVIACANDEPPLCIPLFLLYILSSGLLSFLSDAETSKTSSQNANIVFEKIMDDKLVIVTLEGKRLEFGDYATIKAWEKGEKTLKKNTYFTKDNFGFDENELKYEFE
jgi:hypothetical protein